MNHHCSSLLVQVLVVALHGVAFVPIASAGAYSADWKRPETTRRYLQAPFAERLVVSWREGKVTVGEVRHERDWSLTAGSFEGCPPSICTSHCGWTAAEHFT